MKAAEVTAHLEKNKSRMLEAQKTNDWQTILQIIVPELVYLIQSKVRFFLPKWLKVGITALLFAMDAIDEYGNYKKRDIPSK